MLWYCHNTDTKPSISANERSIDRVNQSIVPVTGVGDGLNAEQRILAKVESADVGTSTDSCWLFMMRSTTLTHVLHCEQGNPARNPAITKLSLLLYWVQLATILQHTKLTRSDLFHLRSDLLLSDGSQLLIL